MRERIIDVRFSPLSGHVEHRNRCPLSATSGHARLNEAMTQQNSSRAREAWPYNFLVWGIVSALIAGSTCVLYIYGSTRIDAINSYYGRLLDRRELEGVYRAHYWKDGTIFWVGRRHLRRSDDLGITAANDIALPESFEGPARFISESILADKWNVYLRQGDQFKRVLRNFRCWYICGSRMQDGDFVVGEYGSRIYRLDITGQALLLLEKPPETRHFHFTAVDAFTNDIYTSLGDAHKSSVTGIMRSEDNGKTWRWLHRAKDGLRETHRQPTAVYFDKDLIYFGADNRPNGIFTLNRNTGQFEQAFVMDKFFKSWFLAITKAKGSFWAISRSFTNWPDRSFGVMWWSADGKNWIPIQIFEDAPVWLQTSAKRNLISVGFLRKDSNVVAFKLPDAAQMAEWVSRGPTITFVDRLLGRELRGPFH